MSDNQRFTAEMLRPYEYIFKNERHPKEMTEVRTIEPETIYVASETLALHNYDAA